MPPVPGHLPAYSELVDQAVVIADPAEVPGQPGPARGVRSDASHIHPEAIAHVVPGLGHLRDPVQDLGFAGQAEHLAQRRQGADIDASDHRAAEVERDTVRFPMVQSRDQAPVARPFRGPGAPQMAFVVSHP